MTAITDDAASLLPLWCSDWKLGGAHILVTVRYRPCQFRELRLCTGNSGRSVAESFLTETRSRHGKIKAIGAEVIEIVNGKIKEIRDYCQPIAASPAIQALPPLSRVQGRIAGPGIAVASLPDQKALGSGSRAAPYFPRVRVLRMRRLRALA